MRPQAEGTKRQRGTSNPPGVKMILLGKEEVGKSALMVRFLTRRFITEYDPSLESTHRRQIVIGNSSLIIDVKDCAGELESEHREVDYNWADAFVLVYSITDQQSFTFLKRLQKFIDLVRSKQNAIFVVIANKKDLSHFRQVAHEEGKNWAETLSCLFFELSVADGYHETNKVFHEIIRYILYKKAAEEGTATKKRNNSFSSLLKSLEKQHKQGKEYKEQKSSKDTTPVVKDLTTT